MIDWQPIKTAPRDGTEVLIWALGGYAAVVNKIDEGDVVCRAHDEVGSHRATHWAFINPPVKQ